jgi:catechol 2,3-dioxygenase-like lactoylglutathione lyase family enzyme
VFFVSDIGASKRFYNEALGQKIVADFGANVGFEGGLSPWEISLFGCIDHAEEVEKKNRIGFPVCFDTKLV